VLAILLTHEMGHFLATVRYRISASFPYFLPLPISPLGTLGAVIRMDGMRANRREIFDIGLAGPLAGLLVAIPITWVGIQQIDTSGPQHGPYAVHPPLAMQAMMYVASPGDYSWGEPISQGHLNPYLMAGWVGLLITGLNMLPVSQLDGGHVVYTLFGRQGRWIARGFIMLAMAYILISGARHWLLMVVLVMFIGVDHPPTRDDTVPLGWFRTTLGYLSLTIPLLCFAPEVMTLY
jgi:membrane-associated protease RseP (regulator of RpoE activity)